MEKQPGFSFEYVLRVTTESGVTQHADWCSITNQFYSGMGPASLDESVRQGLVAYLRPVLENAAVEYFRSHGIRTCGEFTPEEVQAYVKSLVTAQKERLDLK